MRRFPHSIALVTTRTLEPKIPSNPGSGRGWLFVTSAGAIGTNFADCSTCGSKTCTGFLELVYPKLFQLNNIFVKGMNEC